MKVYMEILRPVNAIMAVVSVLLVALIGWEFDLRVLVACFVVFIATGAGNVINDYFDYEIDAINRPQRPIPSGRIRRGVAGAYGIGLFILASALGFYLGPLPGFIVVGSSLLMIYYAHTLKRKCFIGNLVVSFLTGLSFVFGGLIVGETVKAAYIGFYAFLMTMAREIIKDMEDIEGDKMEGATTLPIKYGHRIASIIAATFMLIASLTSPILYTINIFSILYIPILSIAIIVFLKAAFKILKDPRKETAGEVSKQIKIGMGITFIAFALGSRTITRIILGIIFT
ncbi:MAG TPA: UbiA family prenyltransferase [Methanothermobacter sp.]|jgi:geranylgeranylglycerol-phosphate geranylgeranyltransferase|uniref:Digeranylgeranylglyceryl phosphate synthase n=1 Tax=Methanothermobacter tenebrarum TaxID=680118 RepID=A0ABM7YCI0_9EURY|nr:UbiA family prenyltransferase [Methanothermobacter tenebrarum]MDD3455151.1 UbiA family prenyltransferase [Methanobacteriales archaeon]MDX9693795.1 UbiA family prenyltransferase [Methanothermobacter sp.]BDH78935.1 prenyltransferase [Methanothermobacter tenebrarum]HHW17142.1 UbiA family prenyltransferase [Methanothermobacter sp.]HOQ19592.1 UbiA family prenyltransferase [Methanothermobacter sp.]